MMPIMPRGVHTFAALGGVPWGVPVGAVVLLVAEAARPRGLMGRVMVRPLTAPSYEASCPGSYTPPPNGFPLGHALQLAPGALQLHPPPFLQVEEQQLPMGAPHQGPPRPRKNFGLREIPSPNRIFLFFSSFFFSFFLLFLSCSEESVDSSLEQLAAGQEAGSVAGGWGWA